MKDPRICPVPPSSSSSSQMILDQQESEEEPFAEYMWMEHEEEFNRQVSSSLAAGCFPPPEPLCRGLQVTLARSAGGGGAVGGGVH